MTGGVRRERKREEQNDTEQRLEGDRSSDDALGGFRVPPTKPRGGQRDEDRDQDRQQPSPGDDRVHSALLSCLGLPERQRTTQRSQHTPAVYQQPITRGGSRRNLAAAPAGNL